jgi:hypothetical protein
MIDILRHIATSAVDGKREHVGQAYFRSLGALEHWAEHHPMHEMAATQCSCASGTK